MQPISQSDESRPGSVKNALILAAGFGSRIQTDGRKVQSKPLIKMGGLLLIERAVHNLAHAGIQNIRIVVGAYKDQVIEAVRALKSLRAYSIEFVDCVDFEKGNGASLAAGSRGWEGSFLVVMADHVMSPDLIPHFVRDVEAKDPSRLYLATDEDVPHVFDLDDATKVWVENSEIVRIGKNIPDYNQVDTGLFYFPARSAAAIGKAFAGGAHSVSEIVATIKADFSFRAQPIHALSFWQDVDTPEMAKEAEKRLLKSLVSQEDGWISRYLNRPISLRLSLIFSRLRWHPNVITTLVLGLSMISAWVASRGDAWNLALAGVLFQMASVLDGCDGEVARMTYRQTRWGAWYDTATHHLRYGAFFFALGWGLWQRGGPSLYLLGAFLFVLFLVHLVIRMWRFELKLELPGQHRVVRKEVLRWGEQTESTLGAWVIQLRNLAKQDFVAFLAMIFCLLGGASFLFWIACVGLVLMTVVVDHVLAKKDSRWVRGAFHSLLGSEVTFLFFAAGATLMLYVYSHFPMAQAFHAYLRHPEFLPGLVVLPLAWFALNAYAISQLLGKTVSGMNLFKSQIVGEAMNALVPVSGMMVESVKARYFSQWLPAAQSHRSVFEDRLLHISAGLSFAALLGIALTVLAPLTWAVKIPFFVASCFMGGSALFVMRVFCEPEASQRVMSLLVQLGVLDGKKEIRLYPGTEILRAWLSKLLGRSLTLLEIAVLFAVLGLPVDAVSVGLVMAGLSFASIVAFWIPQGLGVHEIAVILIFKFLGLPLDAAVVLCALRRLRMLGFSVLGVSLLLKQFTLRKVKNSVQKLT